MKGYDPTDDIIAHLDLKAVMETMTTRRNRDIYLLRLAGYAFVDIAERYGISTTRVRYLYLQYHHGMERKMRLMERYGESRMTMKWDRL